MRLFLFWHKKETAKAEPEKPTVTTPVQPGSITTVREKISTKNYNTICESFIAFDTETTGLTAGVDAIIEIGAVKFVRGEAVASYGTLINEGVHVPPSATRVNHITTEMLAAQGKNPQEAYREFTEFLGDVLDGTTYLCAHNATFDMKFLTAALEKLGYNGEIHYIDTLSLSRQLLKELPDHKQNTIAHYYNIQNPCSHRAVTDAETCGKILLKMLPQKRETLKKRKSRAQSAASPS